MFSFGLQTLFQSQAADLVWTNTVSGSWGVAANWSPNQIPSGSDNVFITNNGSYTVTINANAAVGGLTVGGGSVTQTFLLSGGTFTVAASSAIRSNVIFAIANGTLMGSGDVTIAGTLNWSAGNMGGPGHILLASGAGGNFTGTGTKGLARIFDNAGTVNYSGNGLLFGYPTQVVGTFNNLVGGVFNVTGEGDFATYVSTGHSIQQCGHVQQEWRGNDNGFQFAFQ